MRVTDKFMEAVEQDGDWTTTAVVSGQPMDTFKARALLNKMAEAAWVCGDPGIQYHDNINRWHTSANTAPINASNPCSEYMYLDDSACNLASLNLMTFVKDDGEFDIEGPQRGAGRADRPGDPPTTRATRPADREEQPRLPAAGPGLRQPGRAAHEPRAGLHPMSQLRGGDHRHHAGEAELQSAHPPRPGGPFTGYAVNGSPTCRSNQHRDAAYQPTEDDPTDLLDAALTTRTVLALDGARLPERANYRSPPP